MNNAVNRVIIWASWITSFGPVIFLISLVSLFVFGYNINPGAKEAHEIAGTATFSDIAWLGMMLSWSVVPLWLVLGIADLLSKAPPYYLRMRYIGTFTLGMIAAIITIKIVNAFFDTDVVSWWLG